MASPYDEARAHRAPPPSRGIPGLAIFCKVPSPGQYAVAGASPLLAILLSFRRLFEDDGRMDKDMLNDKDPRNDCYRSLKFQKVQEEIYVNFGELSPAEYVEPIPAQPAPPQLASQKFADKVWDRYQRYQAPGAFELCMKDPGFARSKDIINMFGGSGPYLVMKKRAKAKDDVEEVLTFYEAIWRRENRNWNEALLIHSPPVGACYHTKQFEFSAPRLQPSPDNPAILTDNVTYFTDIKKSLGIRVRQMNALLCAIGNFGDLTGAHPSYVERFEQVKVEIGGHTDDIGGDAYNKKLSANRAEKVRAHLKEEMKTVLTYAPSVKNPLDAVSAKLASKGYSAAECATKDPQEDRTCRKISVRLTQSP